MTTRSKKANMRMEAHYTSPLKEHTSVIVGDFR